MANWRDELQTASFRGVQFHVTSAEQSGGRELGEHTVRFSEKAPYLEDLGKTGQSFPVEAVVVGDEYRSAVSTLLKALEQPGSGQLVHPAFGVRTVSVKTFRKREESSALGKATISIEFVENSAPVAPTATVDALSVVKSAASALSLSAANAFVMTAVGLTDTATTAFGATQSLVNDSIGKLSRGLSALPIPAELLSPFRRELLSPSVLVSSFTGAPAAYFPALLSVAFSRSEDALAGTQTINRVAAILSLYEKVAAPLPDDATDEQQANFMAVVLLMQRQVLSSAASLVITQQFDSYDDALIARASVVDAIDRHAEASVDDTYASLVDLRIAVANAVPGVDSRLPRLQMHTPAVGVPSLVLAHRLYGDVEREEEIISRNHLRFPAFVPAGRALEVLSV